MQVQGRVEVFQEKNETAAGKRLRSPLYNVKLDNGQWYNFGFDNPRCGQNDVITFDSGKDAYGNTGDAGTVRVEAGQVANPSAVTKQVNQTADARQTSIVYQSQHRDSITAVQFAIENDLIKLPAKQAAKYDVYLDLIKDLTVQWTTEALNPDLTSTAVEPAQEVDEDE